MKCQSLFSGEKMEKYFKLSSAENLRVTQHVQCMLYRKSRIFADVTRISSEYLIVCLNPFSGLSSVCCPS